jgi:hypothetical protein
MGDGRTVIADPVDDRSAGLGSWHATYGPAASSRGVEFERDRMQHLAVIAAMAIGAVLLVFLGAPGEPPHPSRSWSPSPDECPHATRARRSGRSARPGHHDHRCHRPAAGFWSEDAIRRDWPEQVPATRTHLW